MAEYSHIVNFNFPLHEWFFSLDRERRKTERERERESERERERERESTACSQKLGISGNFYLDILSVGDLFVKGDYRSARNA